MTPVLEVGRLVLWRLLLWAAAEDALLEFLDRPTQVRVAAVVLHEADVSSSVQTFKRTSLVQVGLFLRGLEARGKLSLVTAHGGMHSLDLARVRSYPLPAEGYLVLEPGNFRTEITRSGNIVRQIGACISIVICGKRRIVHSISDERVTRVFEVGLG